LATNQQSQGTTIMNKARIIAELENMVVARLFSRRRWLADAETCCAVNRNLVRLGLIETISEETKTSQATPLGKELDVELFEVFFGTVDERDVPGILERYHLIDESEADAIYEKLSDYNNEFVLIGRVKHAYYKYRKATKFLH